MTIAGTTTGDRLVDRVLRGDHAAVARMLSRVESGTDGVHLQLARLYDSGRRAHVVGVTGASGSGKSSLVAALAQTYRRRDRTVGVLAVDPSSPFSGGSVLGDRIRMGDLAGDGGVFIRSMATRGALGGLARTTVDAVTVLEAAGKDVVIVETVGVGQDEVDIAGASHTTVLVSVPGLGDAVQAIKAGIMEIADIHVVNKADREGADAVVAELREMLRHARYRRPADWRIPIQTTVAITGDGVDEFADAIEAHREWLSESDALARRERDMAASRLRNIVTGLVLEKLDDPATGDPFEKLVDRVARRQIDPFTAANQLLERTLS
ncbi:MAG: methylmalonyl Co-A mutase-associated GTPase MeaB [Propionibacteriales bacterium]|nr:methylmalonyl Co-A mutase-associated GTPase MeaB [Propionibacteriales bacterium]